VNTDHSIGRGNGSAQVEVAGSFTEVDLDMSDRGSLQFKYSDVNGRMLKYVVHSELIPENKSLTTGDFRVIQKWRRADLIPAGRYLLRTSLFHQFDLDEIELNIEIRAGELTIAELEIPKKYVDTVNQ